MIRLTAGVRQQLLDVNEGFTRRTSYEGKNGSDYRTYTITGGELHIRAKGKTSWADSRYDDPWVATDEEVHRFLRKYYDELNWAGVVQTPAVRKPQLDIAASSAGVAFDTSVEQEDEEDDEEALDKLKAMLGIGIAGVAAVYLLGDWVWRRGIRPSIDKRRTARAERRAALLKQNAAIQAETADEISSPE